MDKMNIIDKEAVLQALDTLHGGKPFEIRIIGKGKPRTKIFDNPDGAVQWLSREPMENRAAYVSLNEISEEKLDADTGKALVDVDMSKFRWLFVDMDPIRPKGTNSNEEELLHAENLANLLFKFMCEDLGFNEPLKAMSGNGYHALWRIDVPNDDTGRKLIKDCLYALDEKFSNDKVDIDTSVCNPSRITKLYGTVPRTKKASPDRPHRMSRIIQAGDTGINATELLEKLAAMKKPPEKSLVKPPKKADFEKPATTRRTRGGGNFDPETFLIKHGIPYRDKPRSPYIHRFLLEKCPFNADHTGPDKFGDSAVFVHDDGGLGFKCLHSHCSNRQWKDFRLFFEPDAYDVEAFTGVKAGQEGVKNKWGKFFDTDEGYTCYEEWAGKGSERHIETVIMCKATIQINRILRDISDNGKMIVDLTIVRPSGARQSMQIPAMELLTTKIQNYAGDLPLTTKKALLFTEYFDERLNNEENLQGVQVIEAVPSLGWYRGEFVPYSERFALTLKAASDDTCKAITTKGTLEAWVEAVRPVREKSEAVRLSLAASLASVLLEPFNMQGFTCHIEGETGIGKSAIVMNTVASIWGNPKVLVRGFDSTENAMIDKAALHKNLPLILDESMTLKSRRGENISFDSIVYKLSQGMERARLNADSSQKKSRKWALISFFAGEVSLTDDSSEAGSDNRVMRIQATREELENTNIAAFIDALQKNHGHAGRGFVEWLRGQGFDDVKKKFEEAARKLKADLKGSDISSKQMQSFFYIVFADMYLSQAVFKDSPYNYVSCAKRHLKTKKEISKAEKAYMFLLGKITENQDGIINDRMDPEHYPKTIIGKRKDGIVYIIMSWANGQLKKANYGFAGSYLKEWYKAGYLVRDSRKPDRIGGIVAHTIMFKNIQKDVEYRLDPHAVYNMPDDLPF